MTVGIDPILLEAIMEQAPDNTKCFDCSSERPQMASVNNGIFICINCAAIHGGYGEKNSKVKSVTLDPWSELEVKMMQLGGNRKLVDFFETYGLNEESSEERLSSEAAAYYRRQLVAQAQGQAAEEVAPNLASGRSEPKVKPPTLIGKGLGFLTAGAAAVKKGSDTIGLTDELRAGKDFVKAKAEEHKVAEKATAAGQTVKRGAQNAAAFTK